MSTGPQTLRIDLTDTGMVQAQRGALYELPDIINEDTLYYRWTGESVSTGTVQIQMRCSPDEPNWYDGGDLTLDGAINSIDIKKAQTIAFAVSSSESGVTGTLAFFTRKTGV